MPRAFLFVLDSVGIGGAPDAKAFDDVGANTVGHIAKACFKGSADKIGMRAGKLSVPNLETLGLGLAAQNACGELPAGFDSHPILKGRFANAIEVSKGKDTPSGHWEIAGVPVESDWGYFPNSIPAFPETLTEAILQKTGLPGILGNKHASGTAVLEELGEKHVKTGMPICYTSADSVFQIAAHENHFGLERLYDLCETVFELTAPMNIGRVIARPFLGETSSTFERTGNRRDFSIKPPHPTLLERLKNAGREVIAIGKIADIYAHQGPTKVVKANGNANLAKATLEEANALKDGGLLMTNFVDFDMLFGHRRDVSGYADALEKFDLWLPQFMNQMLEDDLMIITADHGCDPTWRGVDHTREQVPVLIYGGPTLPGYSGTRQTFSDIGETIASYLGIKSGSHGSNIELL
jgi:phosphopentomutase